MQRVLNMSSEKCVSVVGVLIIKRKPMTTTAIPTAIIMKLVLLKAKFLLLSIVRTFYFP